MLFLDVREAFDPRAVHEHRVAWHKLCDDTVSSVHCGHESYRRACDGVPSLLLHTRRKTRSSNKGRRFQEPSKQRVSQIGETWRSYDERKVDLDEIVRGA